MKDETSQHKSLQNVMQMNQKQNQVSEEDLADLERCRIDYQQADLLVKKLHGCIPKLETLNQVLSSLVEVFSHHFSSAEQNAFDSALMVWRGMILLLNFEEFREWEWNVLLNSILKTMNEAHVLLRK